MKKKAANLKKSSVLLVTDQDYMPVLLKLLSKARKDIKILSFSFGIGSASGKLNLKSAPYEIAVKLKTIKQKQGDSIRIRFFTEGHRETSGRNRVTAEFLADAGIEVAYGSTHAKGFLIDNRYLFFGSTNLTHQSIKKNHEANVLIDDKDTAIEFNKYFEHLWSGGCHGDVELKPPLLADGSFKEAILSLIKNAKKEIAFSIYFFNHREIEGALVDAHKRGVKIKGFIHQHASFALSYIRANKATVKRMKTAGISDLHFGPPHTFSHSKYIVADKKEFALGTGNWLVEDVEIHPQLYIHLKEPETAKELVKHVEYQIKNFAAD